MTMWSEEASSFNTERFYDYLLVDVRVHFTDLFNPIGREDILR